MDSQCEVQDARLHGRNDVAALGQHDSLTCDIAEQVSLHKGRKASLLLQRASARWEGVASMSGRAAYVQCLEERLAAACSAEDQRALRAVFRGIVAALAAPRGPAACGDGAPLEEEAAERLRRALQGRLRRLALQCLSALDLQDERSWPALARVSGLIQQFERQGALDVSAACSGGQWRRLKALVEGSAGLPACAAGDGRACVQGASQRPPRRGESRRRRRRCEHGKHLGDCAVCQRCPHGKAVRHCAACTSCPHGRLRRICAKCVGCEHGRLRHMCSVCKPCPHGALRIECAKCCACPHGRVKRRCSLCRPCPHGKLKKHCRHCVGCPHGRLKDNCSRCSPCPHGRVKRFCVVCSGCPHGKRKHDCRLCKGCPHGRIRRRCPDCKAKPAEAA